MRETSSPPASPSAFSHWSFFCSSRFWQGIRKAHSNTSDVAQNRGTRKNALRTACLLLPLLSSVSRMPDAELPAGPTSTPIFSRAESLWLQYWEALTLSLSCLLGSLSIHSSSSSSSCTSSVAPTIRRDLPPRRLAEPDARQLSRLRPFRG